MRMKVWGEISGERHLVGTLEMIPGREEQFVYADSYLENEAAHPLSILLPLREEPFPARQTRAFFRNLLPEGGALAAVAKTLEVKSSSYLKVLDALGSECIGALILESDNGSDDALYGYDPLSREELGRAFEAGARALPNCKRRPNFRWRALNRRWACTRTVRRGFFRSIFCRREPPHRRIS